MTHTHNHNSNPSYVRQADADHQSYCDGHGNCLPPQLGRVVPLISYAANWLSYNLSMVDSIKPETSLEKLGHYDCFNPSLPDCCLLVPRDAVISTWSNFTVRVLSLVLSLSYLGHTTATLLSASGMDLDSDQDTDRDSGALSMGGGWG